MVFIHQSILNTRTDTVAEQFWRDVDLTLAEVFDAPTELARQYRERVDKAPARERAFTYHATPLQIAADLTETDVVSNEQFSIYRSKVIPRLGEAKSLWKFPLGDENFGEPTPILVDIESSRETLPPRSSKRNFIEFLRRLLR